MRPEDETSEPELIAKAFQEISLEIAYEGLAKILLEAALGYSRTVWGIVLLSQGGELLAEANPGFPRKEAGFPRKRVKYFVNLRPARSGSRIRCARSRSRRFVFT
jgi:hypothetical protein